MEILIAILFAAAVVTVALALVGRSAREPLQAAPAAEGPRHTFGPGQHRVEYPSRGQTVVANLFVPDDYVEGEQRPGIVLAPAATAVKEHATQVYAERFSALGYVTLAFDPRGIGESGGADCDCNPFHHANDVASSVGFLSALDQVDSDKLINLGVCAGALPAIYDTFQDERVKVLGLVVPSISGSEDLKGTVLPVRWILYVLGGLARVLQGVGVNLKAPAIPDDLSKANDWIKALSGYYKGRASHPRWKNGISVASLPGIATMHIYDHAVQQGDTPVFMASGTRAESLEPAARFYDMLTGPKEKLLVEGSDHTELYWKEAYVDQAVAGLHAFFQQHI